MDLFSQPTEPTGEELKQKGIAQAIRHANQVVERWADIAYLRFVEYLNQPGITEFKTEDARVYAEGKGVEIPPTKRAWGGIALRAARNGLIVRAGFVPCNNPKAHKAVISLWRRAVTR